MIKSKEEGNIHGQMEDIMKESGKMGSSMGKVNMYYQMAR